MDLTDRQRKLVFAGLVVLLAAAGVFLTIGGGSDDHKRASRPSATPTTGAAPATTSAAPVIGSTPPPGGYDIYSMLPFSQKDFNAAADVTRRFVLAYGTYRFDEDPKVYAGRLQGIATPDLESQLQRDASAPGLVSQRTQDQEVSTSDARLDSIRNIGKDQLIFLATGQQHLTQGGKKSDSTQQYAVTVTRSGGSWVVYAFQPADVGDK